MQIYEAPTLVEIAISVLDTVRTHRDKNVTLHVIFYGGHGDTGETHGEHDMVIFINFQSFSRLTFFVTS